MGRHVRSLLVGLVVALAAAACGTSNPQHQSADRSVGGADGSPEDFSWDELHVAAEHMHVWATLMAHGIDAAAGLPGPVEGDEDPSSPLSVPAVGGKVHAKAVQILGELDLLLREWAALANFAGHETIVDNPDSYAAVVHQLEETRSDLTRLIADLYEMDAADDFEQYWARYTQALLNLAQAMGADDEAAVRQAHEEATQAIEQLADWGEDVTGGIIRPDELHHELDLEVKKLAEAFEAIANQAHEWYPRFRESLEHVAKVAELLAEGFAEDLRLEGDVHSEAAKTLAELSGAMEDYVYFAAATSRAKIAEGREEDLRTAEEVTAEATAAIAEVVERRLGLEPATRVHELWLEHTPWFLDVAASYGQDDVPPRDEIEAQFADWSKQVGELLAEITGGKLSAESMEKEAAKHVETVLAIIDAQASVLGG